MRIGNDIIATDGTDMSTSITSSAVWLGHICNFAIQAVFTGAPTGALKLQCSNDIGAEDLRNPDPFITNWTDISGSSQSISAAGNHTWNQSNAGYRWVRVIYTSVSGAGTLSSLRFNVKGV